MHKHWLIAPRTSSGNGNPVQGDANVAFYWVASDATNGVLTNWPYRTGGVNLVQTLEASAPFKTNNFVRYVDNNRLLSNAISFNRDTYTAWVICLSTNKSTFGFGNVFGFSATFNGIVDRWDQNSIRWESTGINMAQAQSNHIYDIVVMRNTSSLLCFTNGVLASSNSSVAVQNWTSPILAGNRANIANGGFCGLIYELALATNFISSNTLYSWHAYATNTYGFSP